MIEPSRLVVVVPDEVEAGFRLAGATIAPADGADEAAETIDELLREGERGVIGIYEPWLMQFPVDFREWLEGLVAPVVVGLPSGLEAGAGPARQARLAGMLRRALGYHITFGGEE